MKNFTITIILILLAVTIIIATKGEAQTTLPKTQSFAHIIYANIDGGVACE